MPCKEWYFREWASEDSDIHGMKHFTRQKGGVVRKTIWLVCFLAATGYFGYIATNAFLEYFNYHHVTKVDVLYGISVEYPAVTVCNLNKYRESQLTEHDVKNVGVYLGIIDEDHNVIDPHLYTEEFVERMNAVNWTDLEKDDNFDMAEFQKRTGHQLDDLVIECKWKEMDCDHDVFIHRFTHLGNCYTFNDWTHRADRHFSSTAGASNGLKLIIDIEESEYTPSNDLDASGIDAGIKIMLHHPTEPPYIKELGFSAGPGIHSFFSMRHEQISALPEPYTPCELNGQIQYYDHYSLQACRIECETKIIEDECGCRLPEQPGEATVCNPELSHLCAHPLLLEIIEGTSGHDDCICRNPCEVEQYPITPSQARLRPAFIEKMFHNTAKNMTEEYIASNVAVVSIYYEALNYETIIQRPEMTLLTLLATIGGNMGLFIGASLLSFVQIMEYFVDETLFCLGCLKKNKMTDSNQINHGQPMHVVSNGNDKLDKKPEISVISAASTPQKW